MKPQEIRNVSSLESALMAYGHLPPTVATATSLDSLVYFTAEPCNKGHFSPRYTKNQSCVFCQKEMVERSRKKKAAEKVAAKKDGLATDKIESLARTKLAIMAGEKPFDCLVATYLIISGCKAIIPGVISGATSVIKNDAWLAEIMKSEAARKSIYVSKETGVVFMPSITTEHQPKDDRSAAYWRECMSGMEDCLFTYSVRCMITTLLMQGDEDTTDRKKSVLEAWLGIRPIEDDSFDMESFK